MLGGLGRDKGFLCRDKDFSLCVATGVFLVVTELFFICFYGATMFCFLSCQCRDKGSLIATETAEAIGKGCDRSLVKAKIFHVAIEICSVVT